MIVLPSPAGRRAGDEGLTSSNYRRKSSSESARFADSLEEKLVIENASAVGPSPQPSPKGRGGSRPFLYLAADLELLSEPIRNL